jgi:hypothetical protein
MSVLTGAQMAERHLDALQAAVRTVEKQVAGARY